MSPQPATSPSPQRILVRGVNWLGDAVMSTPALLRLRERFPQAHIALLTPEKLRELWQKHPALNEIIPIRDGESVFAVGRKLRRGRFDLALVLPNSPRSALEVWLAKIPRRVGYARSWRNFFLTQAVAPRPGHVTMHKRSVAEIRNLIQTPAKPVLLPYSAHQMHEYLHLASILGAKAEPLAPQAQIDPQMVSAFGPTQGRSAAIRIGLNPGAEYGPAKRWPVEKFAEVANKLYQGTLCEFLIFGGKRDVELAEHLAALLPEARANNHVLQLAGTTTLTDLMAGLKQCQVLLTNDTGPMHIAAALGVPVVVPFGSTSPELTGPGLPGDTRHKLIKANVPCSPCFRRECPIDFRCMKDITMHQVVTAVLEALK